MIAPFNDSDSDMFVFFFCAVIKIGIKSIDFETTENVFGCRRSPLFLLFLRARSMGSDGVHDTNSCVGLDTSIDPHFHSTIVAHNFYAQFSHSESRASNVLLCLWSVNIHSNQHACSYLDVCCFVWLFARSPTDLFVMCCVSNVLFQFMISNKFQHPRKQHTMCSTMTRVYAFEMNTISCTFNVFLRFVSIFPNENDSTELFIFPLLWQSNVR